MTENDNREYMSDRVAGDDSIVQAKKLPGAFFLFSRVCFWPAFVLLVLLAVYTTAGRLFMGSIAGQVARVESQLSGLLGAPVSIAGMSGGWFRFSPVLQVNGLRLQSQADEASPLNFSEVYILIDAPLSLLQGKLVIDRMSVNRLSLILEQTPQGDIKLAGSQSAGADYTGNIIDFLLNTRSIELRESSFVLQDAADNTHSLSSLFMQINNLGEQHDLEIQMRINGQDNPSHVSMAMTGQPDSDFVLDLWAEVTQLDVLPLLGERIPPAWDLAELNGSGSVWVRATSGGLSEFKGSLADIRVRAANTEKGALVDLSNTSMDFGLWPTDTSGWLLKIQDISLDWRNRPWETSMLRIEKPLPDAPGLNIQANDLELGMVTSIVLDALPLPDAGRVALETLNPRGKIDNLQLDTTLDGSMPGLFRLEGNLDGVAVDAWEAAPAGSGIEGYVQAEATRGFVEVDSSNMTLHLPRIFDEAWSWDRVNSRVHWLVEDGDVLVNSSMIDVANADLQGSVQFKLHNSIGINGNRSSDFSLLVGVREMDVLAGKVFLPTLENIRPTMSWLEDALQGGQLTHSAFVMRLSSGPGGTSDTTSSWYHVNDGILQFQPDWQRLESIRAGVVVRDEKVDVYASEALIDGIMLDSGVRSITRPAPQGGSVVKVVGTADTDTATGLAFLKNSPVREQTGDFMDNWEGSGNLNIDIGLSIPIGANTADPDVSVVVNSSGSALFLPDYQLGISAINGNVIYNSHDGLGAEAVSASLFDFPVILDITTQQDGSNRTTTIAGRGRASITALQDWQGQATFVRNLLDRVEGEIDYDATVEIYGTPAADGVGTRLQLTSRLRGAHFDYPPPFAKQREEDALMQLVLGFRETDKLLTLRYSDFFSGQLLLDDEGIERGQLDFGDRNRNFNVRQSDNNVSGLLITGTLDIFDYDAWETIAMELAEKGGEGRTLEEYLRLADVQVGSFNVAGQTFDDISLQVQRQGPAWHIHGNNQMLAGDLVLSDDSTIPWQVALEYLRFPPREEPAMTPGEEEVDLLEEVNPATLPSFDFLTAELSIGESSLGAVSFRYRPRSNGADIDSFTLVSNNSGIAGGQGTGGADITWDYRNGQHNSSFKGLFTATDLSEVLPAWGHGAFIESDAASLNGTLAWPGSPLAFSVKKATGTVLMDIREGRFVDIDAGSSRLLGAFNFDALVRRLQLDFSDLFRSGYAYDDIDGNLQFTDGVVNTTEPLVIDGPSSRLSINGEINLSDETIAADMQVRIPLSQNISLLAGLLGAWPIALSTYVASKIFAEQVDEFTTIVYRLDGPWENVDAGFEAPRQAATSAPVEEIQ